MVQELSEWKPGKAANEWIARDVMGWKSRKVHGGITIWTDTDGSWDVATPKYSTDVAADYSVLCKVRDTWPSRMQSDFTKALEAIWLEEVDAPPEWFRPYMRYKPGDYAHAAWMALTEGR